ncbi:MAG: hypothetical protein M1572_06590 [Gammaproteobacteria bacterium]|nr:hypothetical protein [Gammaproteobacteria bacterium]MCL5796587.1 hypothetical protein [Gammaproteobacteria bacterium]
MQPITPIKTPRSPRIVLAQMFKSLNGELPIHGGWGYSQQDACIIDQDDPAASNQLVFDGLAIENVFVEKRIYLEFIVARPENQKFSGIEWKKKFQQLIQDDDRYYDHLTYHVSAFSDADFAELKAEFEGPEGISHPNFDMAAHELKRREKMQHFEREYWFDITSFYGKSGW